MKKLLVFVCLFFFNIKILAGDSYTVDKILAVIYHSMGSSVVLQSDLSKKLDEAPRSLNDIILERLMEFDAQLLKITVTEADVDRHMAQVQKINKLSHEDTINIFKNMGLTFEEGKEQLKSTLMIENVVDYRVRKKASVDKQDIINYFEENPEYKEPVFTIAQSFVPFNGSSPALTKIKIEKAIESKEIDDLVNWSDSIELKEGQIAEDKSFIKSLNVNEIKIANITDEGIFLIKLISKEPGRLITFEERENVIRAQLTQERFAKFMKEYQEKLFKSAEIKYF